MNTKLTKTFIKHCNVYFSTIKGLVNGCEFFFKWHCFSKFNINLNKIVLKKTFSKDFCKDFFKNILRIFYKYFPHGNQKSSQKVNRCGSCYHVYTPFFLGSWWGLLVILKHCLSSSLVCWKESFIATSHVFHASSNALAI